MSEAPSSQCMSRGWRRARRSLAVFGLLFAVSCASRPPAASVPQCGTGGAPVTASLQFEEVASGLPRTGQQRDGFDVADMNGDGHLDVITGPVRKGRRAPAIFLGDGNGSFTRWSDVTFPPLPYDYGEIRASDLDGDAVPDLVLASHLRGIVAMINDGGRRFALWNEGLRYSLPADDVENPAFSSRAIELVDWDGDARLDIVALNEGPSLLSRAALDEPALAVWLNRGGAWRRIAQPTVHSFGASLATGDVNDDGSIDAVIASNAAGMRRILHLGRKDGWDVRDLLSLPEQGRVTAVAIVDRSIAVATHDGSQNPQCSALQLVTLGDGQDQAEALWSEPGRLPIAEIDRGDLDGDGDLDLVAMRADGSILTFLGQSRRGFTRDAEIAAPEALEGCNGFDVRVRDVDGDRRGDILAAYAFDASLGTSQRCASGGGFAVFRVRR